MNEHKKQLSGVAFRFAFQAFRIRLGRNLISITTVALGIAFVTHVAMGYIIRKSLQSEDALRSEVHRMYNFLSAELGDISEKNIGVHVLGSLSEKEKDFFTLLQQRGVQSVRYSSSEDAPLMQALGFTLVEPDSVSVGASAVILSGMGMFPIEDWDEHLQRAVTPLLITTRLDPGFLPEIQGRVITLLQPLSLQQMQEGRNALRQESFRLVWITIVSLVMCIMSIVNTLMISVTQRTREIGTMKCLGAMSSFIRSIFLFEAAIIGVVGGSIGSVLGTGFSLIQQVSRYGYTIVFTSFHQQIIVLMASCFTGIIIALLLSVAAAMIPAIRASKKMPAVALRQTM